MESDTERENRIIGLLNAWAASHKSCVGEYAQQATPLHQTTQHPQSISPKDEIKQSLIFLLGFPFELSSNNESILPR